MRFALPPFPSRKAKDPAPAPWSSIAQAKTPIAAPPRPVAGRSSTDRYRAGVLHERARAQAVLTSEHYPGREAAAADLLDSTLSADKITATLAKTPKNAALGGLAFLKANTPPNPDLGAGHASEPGGRADAIWDKIRGRSTT